MSAGKLFHYSEHPIDVLDLDRNYDNDYCGPAECYFKPMGLWVSVEGRHGWKAWCEREKNCPERLAYMHEVILKEDANILKLTSMAKIKVFSKKYVSYPYKSVVPRVSYINWPLVSIDYQGILLTKYNYTYWMKYPWIYPWDCVSACIWDLSCIKKFEICK